MFFFNFSINVCFFFGFFLIMFFNDLNMIWLGMECVSIATIFFFFKKMNYMDNISISFFNKSKMLLKYFFIQVIASAVVFICLSFNYLEEDLFFSIFIFSLCLKLGAFPSYSWVIEIFGTLSLSEMFFLSTIPKLPVFFLMFFFFSYSYYIFFVGLATLFFSMLGGINSSVLSHLLGFSSLVNLSWLMGSYYLGFDVFFFCFFMYFLMSLIFYMLLNYISFLSHVSFQSLISEEMKLVKGLVLFNMLSLPLGLMFYFKLLILTSFFNVNFLFFFLLINLLGVVMYGRIVFFFFFSKTFYQVLYVKNGFFYFGYIFFFSVFLPLFFFMF